MTQTQYGAYRHTDCGTLVKHEDGKTYCPKCLVENPSVTYDPEQPVECELGLCEDGCFRMRWIVPGTKTCTQCYRENA